MLFLFVEILIPIIDMRLIAFVFNLLTRALPFRAPVNKCLHKVHITMSYGGLGIHYCNFNT